MWHPVSDTLHKKQTASTAVHFSLHRDRRTCVPVKRGLVSASLNRHFTGTAIILQLFRSFFKLPAVGFCEVIASS